MKAAVEEQKERVDKATREVEEVVKEMRDGEAKTRDEMREIREEVTNVRDMLPKVGSSVHCLVHYLNFISQMIERSNENHTQSLAELQQELKSLKALLLSRGPTTPSGMTTPIIPPKPSIPAWQLAGSHSSSISNPSLPLSPSPSAPVPSQPNGKGKEVDVTPSSPPS